MNRMQNMQGARRVTETNTCCEDRSYDPLQTMPLAMGYIPWQQWQNVYEGSKGLDHGTIFEELFLPFHHAHRTCGTMGECRGNERMERGTMERRYNEKNCSRERMNQCANRESCERNEHCGRRCD